MSCKDGGERCTQAVTTEQSSNKQSDSWSKLTQEGQKLMVIQFSLRHKEKKYQFALGQFKTNENLWILSDVCL